MSPMLKDRLLHLTILVAQQGFKPQTFALPGLCVYPLGHGCLQEYDNHFIYLFIGYCVPSITFYHETVSEWGYYYMYM